MKTDLTALVFGPIPTVAVTKGSRTDIQTLHAAIIAAESWQEVMLNPDLADALSTRMTWGRALYQQRPRPASKKVDPALYKWQRDLIEELKGTPHDRKIIWYFDEPGTAGKSTLTKILCRDYKAILLPNKSAEAYYLYDGQRICIWDFPRSMSEVAGTSVHVQYGAIECLKNGMIISTKYEPSNKNFDAPHCVVFANFRPDGHVWSQDRYDVRSIFDKSLVEEDQVYVDSPLSDYVPTQTAEVPVAGPSNYRNASAGSSLETPPSSPCQEFEFELTPPRTRPTRPAKDLSPVRYPMDRGFFTPPRMKRTVGFAAWGSQSLPITIESDSE